MERAGQSGKLLPKVIILLNVWQGSDNGDITKPRLVHISVPLKGMDGITAGIPHFNFFDMRTNVKYFF